MNEPARARTLVEMLFAASLQPCPSCGTTQTPRLELVGDGDRWALTGACPACTRPRWFPWATEGNPLGGAFARRHLGDARPSAIIRPGQFVAELDRLLPAIVLEPRRLAPAAWYAARDALGRALTCLLELQKFIAAEAEAFDDAVLAEDERADRRARPERYERAWLADEEGRLVDLLARYERDAARVDALERAAGPPGPAVGALDAASIEAHAAWLRAGRAGAGRLVVAGYDAPGARLLSAELSAARLTDVTLERAVAERLVLADAELREVRATGAHLAESDLRRARIEGGSLAGATLARARFDGAELVSVDLRGARLDRTTWQGARLWGACLDEATFGSANLDRATLLECSLVRADLRPFSPTTPATTRAVFEGCDLRGSRWHGRDIAGAVFVRCKLAGVRGAPVGLEAATFVEPDVSPDGDGSDLAPPDEVRALWK